MADIHRIYSFMCDKAEGIYHADYYVYPPYTNNGWGHCVLIKEELAEDCDCDENIDNCEHRHITHCHKSFFYRVMDTHTNDIGVWKTIKVFLGKGAYVGPMCLISSPQHTERASVPLP